MPPLFSRRYLAPLFLLALTAPPLWYFTLAFDADIAQRVLARYPNSSLGAFFLLFEAFVIPADGVGMLRLLVIHYALALAHLAYNLALFSVVFMLVLAATRQLKRFR